MLKFLRILKGNISTVRVIDGKAEAEVLSCEDHLQTTVRDTTTANCPYRFGSYQCGIVPEGLVGVIATAPNPQRYSIEFVNTPAYTNAQFIQGTLRILQGPGAGEEYDVSAAPFTGTTATVTLLTPLTRELPIGTTVSLYPGCTKTLESCDSYDNLDRGRHFPRVRGSKVYTNAKGIERGRPA